MPLDMKCSATSSGHLETLAQTLEATGDYRVIRRLKPRPRIIPPPGTPLRLGLVVDVETTGLDPHRDEIIELAMTPFNYGLDGTVFSVGDSFQGLRQPSEPIAPEITAITGITNEMVVGQIIDPAVVATFAAPASLVIAHNAAFDRRFLERFSDVFSTKPWACSFSQIDWTAEGFEGSKLAYLAQAVGFFYERHRAMNDCLATIELLAMRLPQSGLQVLTNFWTALAQLRGAYGRRTRLSISKMSSRRGATVGTAILAHSRALGISTFPKLNVRRS